MIRAGLIALALFSPLLAVADPQFSGNDDLAPDRVQSGSVFLTDETRQLQEDNFANPGYLWVDRGKALFAIRASRQSCLDCHQEDGERPMKGAATRYPQVDSKSSQLMNLVDRINECRVERQSKERLEADSDELLSLTAYVAAESRGMPFAVDIEGEAKPYFDADVITFSPAAASSASLVISVMTTTGADCCGAIRSAKGTQTPGRATVWSGRLLVRCTVG